MTGDDSMTGERLLFSSFGGVSSSDSEQSSSKLVTESASEARRPPLEGPLDALLTLEFERVEAFLSVARSLSDSRKVEGPRTFEDGSAVLLIESLLVETGLGLLVSFFLGSGLGFLASRTAASGLSFLARA